MLPDSELSQLLKNARNQLADKQGVTRQEIERQWAEASGYSVDTVRNWLRLKSPSRPPDEALCQIIKFCVKEGGVDGNTISRLRQYLSKPSE